MDASFASFRDALKYAIDKAKSLTVRVRREQKNNDYYWIVVGDNTSQKSYSNPHIILEPTDSEKEEWHNFEILINKVPEDKHDQAFLSLINAHNSFALALQYKIIEDELKQIRKSKISKLVTGAWVVDDKYVRIIFESRHPDINKIG